MPPSDAPFAAPADLLPLGDALRLIRQSVPAVSGTDAVDLAEADRRVLAEPLRAAAALPPFDNSAVDGFSLRFADLRPAGETRLPVLGRIAAGAAALAGRPGTAARIFTGAPLPAGHDTVVMQEHVRLDGDGAILPAGIAPGANRRRAGEDVAAGAAALPSGRRLGPADLALAAALGHGRLLVRRRLRVALFSTGAELADPGGTASLGLAGRFDANRPMLRAMLGRLGATVTDGGILPDRPDATEAALLAAAAGHDLLVTSGGVSSGEEDHVRAAVERAGTLALWRVAVKPGRPVALGFLGPAAFLGLPGNPVSAFVTFATLGRTLLAALAGETADPPLPVRVLAGFAHRKRPGLREYLRVRLRAGPDGPVAVKAAPDGSGIITSLTEADGFAILDEAATALEPGEPVAFLPFAALL